MQCCCKNNVEAAKILGVIFALLSAIGCLKYLEYEKRSHNWGQQYIEYIIIGVLGFFIHLLLTLGAVIHNATVILVYIVLALVYNIVNFIVMCWAYYGETNRPKEFEYVHIFYVTVLYVGIIVGTAWTIKVAGDARTEIAKGTEVPTKEENDETPDENNGKAEEV